MVVSDYIRQKFQTYGVSLTEADMLEVVMNGKVNEADEVCNDNITSLSVGIALFIPSLLMRATAVSENGFSMSWDKDGLLAYYSYLCSRYGIEDKFSQKPKVTFL